MATKDKREAESSRIRVADTLKDIKRGRLLIPDGAEPGLFILTDGRLDRKPEAPTIRTVSDLFRAYKENLPKGAKEETTLACERIHIEHLSKHLGGQELLRGLESKDLQAYIKRRSAETWRGRPIGGDTIGKEIATFRLIWNWAVKQGYLSKRAPVNGLEYPKRDEREPFMTWEEIERRIDRGFLSEEEKAALWECLYLTSE